MKGKITENWMKKYESAKNYFDKNGDLLVPVGYTDNSIELYVFIQQHRTLYKNNKLAQDKIDLLNEIGMVWDAYEYNWNKNYELCKIFYNTHGHSKIPQNYMFQGVNLGTWMVNQRRAYYGRIRNNLTEEKINKLNEIEMVWDATVNVWDSNYLLLVEFYNEHNHIDVPNNFMVGNVNLGKWVQHQRVLNKKGRLSKEHYEMLDSLGMVWDKIEYRWTYFYNLAKGYYNIYGNLLVPQHYVVNGSYLGVWISNQRQYYKGNVQNSNLTEERIKLLDEIGMVWSLSDKPRIEKEPQINRYDEIWNRNFELVKEYLKENNRIKTELVINGVKVGRWLQTQRQAVKTNISKDRKKKLKEIGIF